MPTWCVLLSAVPVVLLVLYLAIIGVSAHVSYPFAMLASTLMSLKLSLGIACHLSVLDI